MISPNSTSRPRTATPSLPRRIESTSNPIIVRARSLRDSRRRRWIERAFLVEGPRFIADFIESGLVPEYLVLADTVPASSPLRANPHIEASEAVLLDISATEHSQGAVAVFPFPTLGLRRQDPSLVVLLDRVQDPGNAGTLIRSAAASGADSIWFDNGAADPFNPKVIRAAAAAHVAVAIGVGAWDTLAALGLRLVVAENSPDAIPVDAIDWTIPSLVVLGNEGGGVAPDLVDRADLTVVVPISPHVESLNVAVAGSVILFEAARQRRRARSNSPTH